MSSIEVGAQKASTCPILVGRGPCMEIVRAYLRSAASGAGGALLIAGEAGIGKSRLVREASLEARSSGFLVLHGSCFETEQSLPFGPVIDLLRTLVGSEQPEAVSSILAAHVSDLSRLLPDMARLPEQEESAAPSLGPEGDKHRLISALGSFLAQLAAVQPLVIVLEDLHWSDDVSLEFLLHIARHVSRQRIMLMATYRSDEIRPALLHTLAELDRTRSSREIHLAPFSLAELDTMLQAIFDLHRPVQLDFLNKIHDLTEGNPFFVEEMLKSLLGSGDVIFADLMRDRTSLSGSLVPRTVQDAVQRRLHNLSGEAHRMLALAAALGKRFSFDFLLELLGLNEQQLLSLIKECIRAQLVVEESPDRFAFRHALTRQAVYSGLLARERKTLHGEIARALEKQHAHSGGDAGTKVGLSELAYHHYEAGLWTRAHELARKAGDEAQALYAPGAAITFYTMAIESAARLGVVAQADLYRARGLAYSILGDFDAALADHTEALRISRTGSEASPRTEWQSLLDLAALWSIKDYRETDRYSNLALKLAREMGEPATVARTLNRVGNWLMNLCEPDQALVCHEEALSIFETLGDRAGIADTYGLLGFTYLFGLDLVKSADYLSRAVELCRETRDRLGQVYYVAALCLCAPSYATDTSVPADLTIRQAISKGEEALRQAREAGWRSGEAFAHITLSDCNITMGNYDAAVSSAQSGLYIAQEIDHEEWIVSAGYCLAMANARIMAIPQATRYFEEALAGARKTGSTHWILTVASDFALTLIADGNLTGAEAVLDSVMDDDMPIKVIAQRVCWIARAEIKLSRNPQAALAIADRLLASVLNVSETRVVPRLLRLRAEALTRLGRLDEAEADLLAASGAARELQFKPLLLQIYLSLGNLYRAQGRRNATSEQYALCRALGEELAESISDDALKAAFLAKQAEQLPKIRPVSAARAAKEAFGGLTTREREVAALISHGSTNRQIGDALFISEETAAVHVKNILSKLNFTSRSQIAAWAAEHSLL